MIRASVNRRDRLFVVSSLALPILFGGLLACTYHIGRGTEAVDAASHVQALWPELGAPERAPGGGENDSALIVGLEDYGYMADVPGANANALAWHRYLTQDLGVPPDRAILLLGNEATKESMASALGEAARGAKAGGRVWFVFIGHGWPSRSGDGLLLGADVQQKEESTEARGLARGEAVRLLEQSLAQPVIVIDACFSGMTGSGEPVVVGLQSTRMVALAVPARALVLVAAGRDQYAGPLPGAAKPAFSYLVLGALRGWADSDGDGQVTANEAVTYANTAMRAVVKGRRQTAELAGAGEVMLARSVGEQGPDLAEMTRMLAGGGREPVAAARTVKKWREDETTRQVAREDAPGHAEPARTAAVPEVCIAGTGPRGFVPGEDKKTQVVDDVCLEVTEVTVTAYARCVANGKCTKPDDGNACNWGKPGRDNHPVNCVDLAQAKAYCAAAGKRLPTEWEWEWAARGGDAGRTYPWGEEALSCARVVMDGGEGCRDGSNGGTMAVGSRPSGNSRDGLKDMAGNVWEWTISSYDSIGTVIRGGSWTNIFKHSFRAADRSHSNPADRYYGVGFRCVRTATR